MSESRFTPSQIAELYIELPATAIKAETGMKLNQIYSALRKIGAEVRPRGRRPILKSPGVEMIQDMLDSGLSQREAAERLRVSKRTLQRWLGK